jgi:hypothetical protein
VSGVRKQAHREALLRERCAVFNETDHGTSENAPLGWVEIQRDDAADHFESDAAAALAVALAGKAEGTAAFYETVTGIMEPIDVMGGQLCPSKRIEHAAVYARNTHDDDPSWICIVPRHVAKAAGLIR